MDTSGGDSLVHDHACCGWDGSRRSRRSGWPGVLASRQALASQVAQNDGREHRYEADATKAYGNSETIALAGFFVSPLLFVLEIRVCHAAIRSDSESILSCTSRSPVSIDIESQLRYMVSGRFMNSSTVRIMILAANSITRYR